MRVNVGKFWGDLPNGHAQALKFTMDTVAAFALKDAEPWDVEIFRWVAAMLKIAQVGTLPTLGS